MIVDKGGRREDMYKEELRTDIMYVGEQTVDEALRQDDRLQKKRIFMITMPFLEVQTSSFSWKMVIFSWTGMATYFCWCLEKDDFRKMNYTHQSRA